MKVTKTANGWKVERWTFWRVRIVWVLWKCWIRLRYALTGDCGLICGYEEPYGFTPQAECPIHDRYLEGGIKKEKQSVKPIDNAPFPRITTEEVQARIRELAPNGDCRLR